MTLGVFGTNRLQLTVSATASTTPSPLNLYWTGGVDNKWTGNAAGTTNWALNAAGTLNSPAIPGNTGNTTNVFFTAETANNLTNALNQPFTINSLNFTGNASIITANVVGSTINPGIGTNPLTINAGAVDANPAGSGITVAVGSGANAINANIVLGLKPDLDQRGSHDTLRQRRDRRRRQYFLAHQGRHRHDRLQRSQQLFGKHDDHRGNFVGVVAGNGGFSTLGASSNAASNLVLNGGTLQYTGTGSSSTDRNFTMGSGLGTLDAEGTGGFIITGGMTNATGASGVQILTLTAGTSTGATANTIAGAIQDGTGGSLTGILKIGTGNWTLSGTSGYTGGTTVSLYVTLGSDAGFGSVGSGITLNGTTPTLDLATDTATINQYPVTLAVSATIASDKATPASAGITHTLGSLSLGALTLTTTAGPNVSGGTPVVGFTAVSLTGATATLAPTTAALAIASISNTSVASTLTLGGTASGNTISSIANGAAALTVTTSAPGR